MNVSGPNLMSKLQALAAFSDETDRLTRTFLSPAHKAAGEQIKSWMQQAGMLTRTDAAANVIGRYEGTEPGLPALLIGSHFDTVRDAGKYDGNLGVLAGIACVEALNNSNRRLPFAIEVLGLSEEEGVRYNATLLGSRAIANTFDKTLLDNHDADGISMRDAFLHYGLNGDAIASAAYSPRDVLGYIEVHIEQGPVLLDKNLPVGIVSAIAGASRFNINVIGLAGHAGTVPMALRKDAAAAASEAVLLIERTCTESETVVGTVGQLQVPGGSTNVIAGKAEFSLDIRSGIDSDRQQATESILAGLDVIAARRQVSFDVNETHSAPAVTCSDKLITQLQHAVRCQQIEPLTMLSGAGHDAMAIAELTEIAMLFVRCGNGGISHHPLETITTEDASIAVKVLLDFVLGFEA